MKNKKQSKMQRAKASIKCEKPFMEAPAAVIALKPAGPPLAGEALEAKVAEVLCERFRGAAERAELRKECRGADHAAIEAAIVSPRVQTAVEPVAHAYALEQVIAVLQLLFSSARAALENKKPSAAQVAALKIIVEILVGKLIERIGGGLWKESIGLLDFSDYEKSLIKNLLQTVRGQRTPVAEGPQRAPDSGQNDEEGD
jgi:hypothetical protein